MPNFVLACVVICVYGIVMAQIGYRCGLSVAIKRLHRQIMNEKSKCQP